MWRLTGIAMLALLTTTACTVYADRPVKAFSEATGGEGFERALWKEIQQQDWKDVRSHIASNFVYVTPTGRWERDAALEEIEKLRLQDYSIADLTTEMNRDAFVVTYTIQLHGTAQGVALPETPERRMSVWQQEKGGWMVIAHSVLGPEHK
jgi:hypothetical protein